MVHQHAHAHLVPRQRGRDDEDEKPRQPVREHFESVMDDVEDFFSTFIEVITKTGRQTEEAPKTLIDPAVRPRPTTTQDDDDEETQKPTPTRRPAETAQTTPAGNTSAASKDPSTLLVATKAPTPPPGANASTAAAGLVSASASATAAAASAESSGMSGGAKAGLALGILVLVGALLIGILLVYRRKKKAMAEKEQENEKIDLFNAPPPPPPQVAAAVPPSPSIRTQRTMSTAPRLSLRPVTQFDATFEEQRKSSGNLLNVAAAGGAAAAYAHGRNQERDLPPEPRGSAWERPGAANLPGANPFNDPEQRSGSPTANPFGNNAALDAQQARIPDSPPNGSPLHSKQPSHDLARGPSAPAGAEIDPVAMAGAMHSIPSDFPAPPTLNADAAPPSPAWTDDIPASPGPAPAGPLPIAGAIVAGGQAPGPNNVHRVQLDFKPSMQDELDLHAGQLVRMLHEYDDGWALCIRMDRSQQGVVPRTCLSKHPVKPRTGPPRQGPPPPGMRGPPVRSPMGPGGVPQPRPLSPATNGRSSPHPPGLQPANGRMSPAPRSMSPAPRQMSPPQMQGSPRAPNAPQYGPPRGRSNSNAPYAGPQRSMSPGPYGGGPQPMGPNPEFGRPRSNSASQAGNQRRGPAPGPSPMNPNVGPMPQRKPVPGMAM